MDFSQQHSSIVSLFLYIFRESITPKLRIILYKFYTVISLVADLNVQLTYDELNNITSENNCESELNNHCKHIPLSSLHVDKLKDKEMGKRRDLERLRYYCLNGKDILFVILFLLPRMKFLVKNPILLSKFLNFILQLRKINKLIIQLMT